MIPMFSCLFIVLFLVLPTHIHGGCCRLPFTDGECRVNRQGPHRYHIMPDRHSGLVTESTECYINDFDSDYRKVIETKNYCNDCPGLLILHANSSEIILFPEYLERILEGRTTVQRKNVMIVTTSLVGAYDLDFTLFSRYYSSRLLSEVPSIYVDLQLPPFDRKLEIQPNLRLRLPKYTESLMISRQDLIDPSGPKIQSSDNFHQLPFLYHFDMEKHRHAPYHCILYNVQVSSSSLIWNRLDSEEATCHNFMPYFGRNRCFATGFTRLFCPIEENISSDDRLELSVYLPSSNRVEHLTIAVIGDRRVDMSLSNDQMRPAEQVKILLLQGHLVITDVNQNLPIRVEHGSNCENFSLVVPSGVINTRFRFFNGEHLANYIKNSLVDLPPCFRVIPNSEQVIASNLFRLKSTSIEKPNSQEIPLTDDKKIILLDQWNFFLGKNVLVYIIVASFILVVLVSLCLCLCYNQRRKSNWTLDHDAYAKSTIS